jgi:hypothetical protein
MEKEPLDVKYINYKDNNRSGFSFVINNINFNWKDLKSFSKLEEIMGNLKNQCHYKTRDFAKPTNLLRNNYTNESILYEEKNILIDIGYNIAKNYYKIIANKKIVTKLKRSNSCIF